MRQVGHIGDTALEVPLQSAAFVEIRGPADVPLCQASTTFPPGHQGLPCPLRPVLPSASGPLDLLSPWWKGTATRTRSLSARGRVGSPRPSASSWGASPEENCRGRRQACRSTLSTAQGVPAIAPPSSSRPGTTGLTLARQAHTVLGMDVSAQATRDATYNAQLTGVSIAHYQVGRTEMLLLELRGQFCADDLCAIVNVGQAGLRCAATIPRQGKWERHSASFWPLQWTCSHGLGTANSGCCLGT
ncbi:uncharacterized protein LOC144168839 isoform X2 [Haemaphysalis longicornis]